MKIVANRRNLVAPAPPTTSNSNSKPAVSGKTTDKPGDSTKKSPVKNTIGNMFSKKNEETEKKKKDAEKSSKEQEKVNGNVKTDTDKNYKGEEKKEVENKSPVKKVPVSPAKKSGITAGKKKVSWYILPSGVMSLALNNVSKVPTLVSLEKTYYFSVDVINLAT